MDAAAAKGQTIHKFFSVPLDPALYSDEPFLAAAAEKMRLLQVLVLDNAHKIPVDLLRLVDTVLRRKTDVDAPFGGLPVVLLAGHSLSAAIDTTNGVTYHLTDQFLADLDYKQFIKNLQNGALLHRHAQKLSECASDTAPQAAVVFVSTPSDKLAYDIQRLNELNGGLLHIPADIKPANPRSVTRLAKVVPTETNNRSECLALKVGARVQLQERVLPLNNHTLATVTAINVDAHTVTVKDDTGNTVTVHRTDHVVGERTQPAAPLTKFYEWKSIPLRLGYAFTPNMSVAADGNIHVRLPTNEQWDDRYLVQVCSRAKSWSLLTWGSPAGIVQPTPEQVAEIFRLKLVWVL